MFEVPHEIASWMLVSVVCAMACDTGPEAGDATSECESLISTFCSRVGDCSLNTSYDECDSQVRTELNCGRAADTSDDYERCLDEIESSECSGLLGAAVRLPASCEGAILVTE
jgi:hypothetical protein